MLQNKILKNTFIISSSGLVIGILNFIVISMLMTKLGFEKYGLYVFLLFVSVNNGFMSLFDFGIKAITTKYLAQYLVLNDNKKINELLSFSILISLFIGVFVSLIIFFIYDYIILYFSNIDKFTGFFGVFKLFVLSYFIQYVNYIFIGIFEGFQRYDISKLIEIFFFIFQSILIIAIVFLEFNINYIIFVLILTYILNLIINIILLKKIFNFKLSFSNFYKMFKLFYSMVQYIFPTQLSSIVYNQYPKFFILSFLNINYLGIYDVAVKIPRFLKIIAGFINSALMPIVSELNALDQKENINNIYEIGFKINIILFTPLLTAVMYFSMQIFEMWLNDRSNYVYMQIFLIWNLLTPYVTFGGPLLVGMNKELKFMKNISWSITLISIIVSFILIQDMNLWGLIYGQLAGFILLPFIFFKYMTIFKVNKIQFILTNIYIYLILIPIIILFNLLNLPKGTAFTILGIILWCIIYYILIYKLILKDREKLILRSVYLKIKNKIKGKI